MLENEDTPTVQRPAPPSDNDHAATIEVPVPSEDDITTVPPLTTQDTSAETEPPLTAIEPTQANNQTTPAPQPAALPYLNSDDLLALRIASDPQISPDSTLVAFTLQQCDAEENTTSSAIWLVSSAGGKAQAPWQVSSGTYHDTMPRWSPDGHTLAFLSDRTGTSQIYLLPLKGGEARQVSTLSQGVSEYSWRPDGTLLLALSAWKPSDDQLSSEVSDVVEGYDLFTRLDAQGDGVNYKHGRHQQLWLISLEGNATRLTSEPVDLQESCWSPDGSEIAFCANRRPNPDLSVNMALWVLTVATGQLRRLTPETGIARMPSWSPDGQFIAYLYTDDYTEAGNIVPWIVSAQGNDARPAVQGAAELLCHAWIIDELRDEYLMRPQWYPDSQALLVAAQAHGQLHLCRLDRAQDQVIHLTSGNGRYISPQLSNDGQLIALVRADWFTPGDIWSTDGAGNNPRKLTRINDAFLQRHQLIRPKRVSWHSTDGLEIEAFLYLPPLPAQAKAPLVVAPHGGPCLAWGDSYVHEFQVLAGRGYAVLAPNPRGSAGYGETFARQNLNDWGGADFQDILAGIDHLIATEPIDAQRLGIGGISYGGYMTNWAITQTDRFKAAVSRNSVSSLSSMGLLSDQSIWTNLCMQGDERQKERSPLTFAERINTPLLLLHAENDLRCPFSESLQLFTTLRKRKHVVQLVRYHHTSHLMDWPTVGTPKQRVDRLRRTIEWFEHFV